jgi:beta-lactamase regulating signal transducer with metallopeptidase domain
MLPNVESVARLTDVAAGWLLTYLVHSTLILGAAWLVTSRKRLGDATRDILWKSALVGGVVTATVQTAVAREPLAGQLRLSARTRGSTAPTMRLALREHAPGVAPRFIVMRPTGTHWTAGLVVFWLTTAGAGLLWLTFGHARTVTALGRRTPLDGTPIGRRLRDLLRRANVVRRIELTSSARIASPVALSGDEVCLPRRALFELEPAEQDSMLAHEIAHLVRRDPQWLVAARVMEMVFFFQPLNRLARRRMQEVAEYLCDDWAVARTSRPITLAKCLAAVAEWVGRAPAAETPRLHPLSAMVESGGSPLVRRVGRILSGRGAPAARNTRVALGVSACAFVVLAGAAPRVSVASAAASARAFTFVRAIVDENGLTAEHDTMIVIQTGGPRVAIDSLVRRRGGARAGASIERDFVYRAISIERASRPDSLAAGVVRVDMTERPSHLRSVTPTSYD